MRIDNPKTQHFLIQYKSSPNKNENIDEHKRSELPQDKVHISISKHKEFKISENNPEDPTVSTKVLDGLKMGMINFSQEQRDVLATIMQEKAAQL